MTVTEDGHGHATPAEMRAIAAHYAASGGVGSGALRYFARTGIVGRGLRIYLAGRPVEMPPRLARLAGWVLLPMCQRCHGFGGFVANNGHDRSTCSVCGGAGRFRN